MYQRIIITNTYNVDTIVHKYSRTPCNLYIYSFLIYHKLHPYSSHIRFMEISRLFLNNRILIVHQDNEIGTVRKSGVNRFVFRENQIGKREDTFERQCTLSWRRFTKTRSTNICREFDQLGRAPRPRYAAR